MSKTKLLANVALAAFILFPAFAYAETDSAPSYANKKGGKVVFEKKETVSEETAAAEGSETGNPADIEPAAGAEEDAAVQDENSLAEQMKLPRKN